MWTRWNYLRETLRTSYWPIPTILNMGAAAIALLLVEIDRGIQHESQASGVWWIYDGGPEGARAVMSTIAGSMITVAGVVFSITIVALSLASGQFGSRLLRNFIRDRGNQFVLGTFTGTFIYCLLVLRSIHGTNSSTFVPGLAVAMGILLALASLGVMIYFIHHVAVSIQADQVIAAVSQEMHDTIDRLWPDSLGEEAPAEERPVPEDLSPDAQPLFANSSGYLAAVTDETLMELACSHRLLIRLASRPGHFVIAGTPLAWVSADEKLDKELYAQLQDVFLLELQRTPYQDLEFTVDQLVEVAVRALSPGINDPFTAIACLDWLVEALSRLALRRIPSPYRYDQDGKLRVITRGVTFSDVADAAFNQIRQYGCDSPAVMIHMLDALDGLAQVTRRKQDQAALARHTRLVRDACRRSLAEPADLRTVEERAVEVLSRLGVESEVTENMESKR